MLAGHMMSQMLSVSSGWSFCGGGCGEQEFYQWLLVGWCVIGAGAFFALRKIAAPYGRFYRQGWGRGISGRLGWFLMESPAAWTVGLLFVLGDRRDPVAVVFCAVWCCHYLYRGFIYPLRLRSNRLVSMFVVLSAIAFNITNGYLQGRWLFHLAPSYPTAWLRDPRCVAGVILFAVGFVITIRSDNILRQLRATGNGEYRIPHGGMFRWVSCPNYFGELLEWAAWALLTWSPPGLVFLFWAAANLVPRALAYHRWYRDQFPDYPADRKAVIPFLL